MKKDYTHITILLDRSGSMLSVANDVIGGIGTFIKEQKSAPGECTISIHQFDNEYKTDVSFKPINEVSENIVFEPRGMTALYDGVGKAIMETGAALSAMKEEDRPEKHIFVIFTDGAENASREFTYATVKPLIEEHTNKYSWEFMFLGANIDAVSVGTSFGLSAAKSMNYAVGSTVDVYASLSAKTVAYRGGSLSNMDFTDDDRTVAMGNK